MLLPQERWVRGGVFSPLFSPLLCDRSLCLLYFQQRVISQKRSSSLLEKRLEAPTQLFKQLSEPSRHPVFGYSPFEVDLFSPSRISEKVLLHLLKHPSVNHEIKFDDANRRAPEHYLYERNQPVDYFILILQGRVEVEIGKEGLKFENGAFTYYGASALTSASSVHQSPVSTLQFNNCEQFNTSEGTTYSMYCPDYTVRALTDLQLIKVTKLQYVNALMASRVNTSPQSPESIEMKMLPNSQTKLLNTKNTTSSGNGSSTVDVSEAESPAVTALV